MTAFQLIRTHLLADSAVTSLATGGIYPVIGAQGETRPMVVGKQSDSNDSEDISATLLWAEATLEIGCVANTLPTAWALSSAVKASMRAMRQTVVDGKKVHAVSIAGTREEAYREEGLANLYSVIFTATVKYQP